MARVSPLRRLHQEAEASLMPYGPPQADVLVVETFGELEMEYAALRRACVVLDRPQRGVIEVRGADRLDFLNRMLTQDLSRLEPFHARWAFWLNRRGRIEADLRVVHLPQRTLLDVDVHAAVRTLESLSQFVIAEDVRLTDSTESVHRLALHGPAALTVLRHVAREAEGPPLSDLGPGQATVVHIAGHEAIVDRDDATGEIGLELTLAVEHARAVYEQLLEAGQMHDGDGPGVRPAGWHAFNIARIEAGTPMYLLDFGPDSLPHETGLLRERVSFTKGCYVGQEIVARMQSRGHPRRVLVALRLDQPQAGRGLETVRQPVTGSGVWSAREPAGDPIGAVTSSTLAPMLGGEPVCFAMIRYDHAAPGTGVLVDAQGQRLPATVQKELCFWRRAPGAANR